jgi:putative methyltransferase
MLTRTDVQCRLADFLRVKSAEHDQVSHILVDPSCCKLQLWLWTISLFLAAGSGIPDRPDYSEDIDEARLQALSQFQTAILSHAMRFPSARTVAYSTCSVHNQENEAVVARVLSKPDFADWSLAHALPEWSRRGQVCEGLTQGQ